MSSTSPERLVEIGTVGRPHGTRGEVRLFLHNSGSDIVRGDLPVRIGADVEHTAAHVVSGARSGGKHLIVALEGVRHRDVAERLRGKTVFVDRDRLPPLEEGEFYAADLVGLTALDSGETLGRVVRSREQGGIEVVTISDGDVEIEVPLVEDYVEELDIAAGRLLVRDVEEMPRNRVGRRRG